MGLAGMKAAGISGLKITGPMQVTAATEEDIPALCGLLELLFSQEAEFRPDAGAQERGLREIIRFPERGRILVLRGGGRVAGMVNLLFSISTALGGPVAILEDMVLRADCRGGGLGSVLLKAGIRCALESGCLRITLLTDGDNEAARRFYRRHGFSDSGMAPMRLVFPSGPPQVLPCQSGDSPQFSGGPGTSGKPSAT